VHSGSIILEDAVRDLCTSEQDVGTPAGTGNVVPNHAIRDDQILDLDGMDTATFMTIRDVGVKGKAVLDDESVQASFFGVASTEHRDDMTNIPEIRLSRAIQIA
jgi:hypothetical protein